MMLMMCNDLMCT